VVVVFAQVIPTPTGPAASTIGIGGQSVRFPEIVESVGGY
ncbi:uncharacterized protein METZ01_LOCUS306176, partial [marine metagenome]